MLARVLTVTSRCSIERDEQIDLVFGMQVSFEQSYTVLRGNLGIYKNNGTSFWNFFIKHILWKLRHGISIIKRVSLRKVDAQSTTSLHYLQVLTTVVHNSDRQTLTTARFHRAGQLASADTCIKPISESYYVNQSDNH